MKFIVQPDGETMQVPALTAVMETPEVPTNGGAVPRQSGLTVASGPASGSGISTPCGRPATVNSLRIDPPWIRFERCPGRTGQRAQQQQETACPLSAELEPLHAPDDQR